MGFAQVTANDVLHHASPNAFNLDAHTFGVAFPVLATMDHVLGVVKTELRNVLRTVQVNSTGPLSINEALINYVRALTPSGQIITLGIASVDSTSVTDAGTFEYPVTGASLVPAPLGSVVYLNSIYVPGGAPLAPSISITVQLS